MSPLLAAVPDFPAAASTQSRTGKIQQGNGESDNEAVIREQLPTIECCPFNSLFQVMPAAVGSTYHRLFIVFLSNM